MQKLLEPQPYRIAVFTIWMVMLPMIVKDVFGFVPSLIAAMLGSCTLIAVLMMVFVKPERSAAPAQPAEATE